MQKTEFIDENNVSSGLSNEFEYSTASVETTMPLDQTGFDAISEITRYYLFETHAGDVKTQLKIYALLFIVSSAAMWMYVTTSGEAAPDNYAEQIQLIIGGAIANFIVAFNTSEAFINYINNRRTPKELLNLFEKKSNTREVLIVGICSFLSSIPLMLAVFSNTKKTVSPLLIIEALATLFANTFIHTLPVMIVRRNQFINLIFQGIFMPFKYGYRRLKNLRVSNDIIYTELEEKIRNQKIAEVKKLLIKKLELSRENIKKQTLASSTLFTGMAKLPDNVMKNELDTGFNYLVKIANYGVEENQGSMQKSSRKRVFIYFLDKIAGVVMYSAGAVFVNFGVIGFYKSTLDNSASVAKFIVKALKISDAKSSLTASILQWGISLPPNLILSVMVGYFGGRFLRDVMYSSFISMIKHSYSLPMAFKFYPKTISFLIILSIYIAYYSRGTGVMLVNEHFSEKVFDGIRPWLIFCAVYGNPIFNFKNILEFIFDKSTQFVRNFGQNDAKAFLLLEDKMKALEIAINNLDGKKLVKSLQNLDENNRRKLLGIELSKEAIDDLLSVSKREIEASPRGEQVNSGLKMIFCLPCLFWRKDDGESRPLLTKLESNINYSETKGLTNR